ncbi:hypothetical protein PACILC2_55110 [Paenibacillus cisolokensis]|uniref:ABC transmembrane type-1 domain-containing protein n=1 Tax=Paenibacillus cisolokensis TaxID=1658519 RepID=A0ABQ4NFC3_9BACL|nr:hypothetical protein PACILC2_55110 [Paenibacillus cisolokensis]
MKSYATTDPDPSVTKPGLGARLAKEWRKNAFVYVILAPVLLHFLVFQAFPLGFSFVLSFMDWPIIGKSEFVGLKNWETFLNDKLAWKSIRNTLMFSLYYILPTMGIGLLLALLVSIRSKLAGFSKASTSCRSSRRLSSSPAFGPGCSRATIPAFLTMFSAGSASNRSCFSPIPSRR